MKTDWLIQMLFTALCFFIMYVYIDIRMQKMHNAIVFVFRQARPLRRGGDDTSRYVPSYGENASGLKTIERFAFDQSVRSVPNVKGCELFDDEYAEAFLM